MGQHATTARRPLVGAFTLAAGMATLATAGLGSAPTAAASCVSLFGIGNSADCTSTILSSAIAIGPNAQAHADGLFGAGFAVGDNAYARTTDPFTFATAAGHNASAEAEGLFGIASQLGPGLAETTYENTIVPAIPNLGLNIAVGVSPGSTAITQTYGLGVGNIALNLFGNATSTQLVAAVGIANTAVNLVGNQDTVRAGGPTAFTPANLSVAFNAFGSINSVTAGPGPLAIAGLIGQNVAVVTKKGPGLAINNVRIGGAASTSHTTTVPAATAVTSPTSHSAAGVGRGKTKGHGSR